MKIKGETIMSLWIDFLKELDVAAVETRVIIQTLDENKFEVVYQEEMDFDNM